jgi:glycosyltransferase involved in cell wall biosynthesis
METVQPEIKTYSGADVCLILEGTYPYVMGGVSNWAHELIKMQSHLTFHILTLMPEEAPAEIVFDIPENVIEISTIRLQQIRKGVKKLPSKEQKQLFLHLKKQLTAILEAADGKALEQLLSSITSTSRDVGKELLMNSRDAWHVIEEMYMDSMHSNSFLDFFWSWRTLFGGLFTILLADLPPARVYHSLCTGYAGIMLARAKIEKQAAAVLTEHGIYTNERRIEITGAEWLKDSKAFNLSTAVSTETRELRQFWSDMFTAYSKLCYRYCDEIITLFGENQQLQIREGAEASKCLVIPNGVDYERFSQIKRDHDHPPTVALIGRVVPIKDVKTFIKAVAILKKNVPDCIALIMGPTDEDPIYYEECKSLIYHNRLEEDITFTGRVKIDDYLPRVDIIALTSISEAQPLVILEAGAAKIPTVATNVGSCSELIYGAPDEQPALGKGGLITKLADPHAIAMAMSRLLNDAAFYNNCSSAIEKRVHSYYNKSQQKQAYYDVYQRLINLEKN